MNAATLDADTVAQALATTVATVAAGLSPDAPLQAGDLAMGDDVVDLLPSADAQAVVGRLDGAVRGSFVLVLSGPFAAAVEEGVGPLPASLAELVAMAVEALADAAGGPITVGALEALSGAEALAPVPDGVPAGAPLLQGYAHVASVALIIEADHTATEAQAVPATPADAHTLPVAAHEFTPLDTPGGAAVGGQALHLLHDVEMGVTAELGRARMTVREILGLAHGSVIELDRSAGAPVDVVVNGTLIARGEVVVIDEEFGVRITEIVGYDADGAQTGGLAGGLAG